MVVLVGMPVRPMFELSQGTSNSTDVMVGDVIVVVCVWVSAEWVWVDCLPSPSVRCDVVIVKLLSCEFATMS
jgi:hypothetical protein